MLQSRLFKITDQERENLKLSLPTLDKSNKSRKDCFIYEYFTKLDDSFLKP